MYWLSTIRVFRAGGLNSLFIATLGLSRILRALSVVGFRRSTCDNALHLIKCVCRPGL